MNSKIIVLVSFLLSLVTGCASSFEHTTRTPMGTRTEQSVSNGFSRDTRIVEDTEHAYRERCMPNRAPGLGSPNADRECAAEGAMAGGMGYGGFGIGGGGSPGMNFVVETYGQQAARPAMATGATYVQAAPSGEANATAGVVDELKQDSIRHDRQIKALQKNAPKK